MTSLTFRVCISAKHLCSSLLSVSSFAEMVSICDICTTDEILVTYQRKNEDDTKIPDVYDLHIPVVCSGLGKQQNWLEKCCLVQQPPIPQLQLASSGKLGRINKWKDPENKKAQPIQVELMKQTSVLEEIFEINISHILILHLNKKEESR